MRYPICWKALAASVLQDLALRVVAAPVKESSPVPGLLVAATENLARVDGGAVDMRKSSASSTILIKVRENRNMVTSLRLARHIIAQDQWLTLWTSRWKIGRSTQRCRGCFAANHNGWLIGWDWAMIFCPGGSNTFPAMSRLVRAAGEPVFGTLETQLSDQRRQRQATAIKLLSAVQPERLATALPRVLPGWEWSLQDLAVSELSRQASAELRKQAARIFLSILNEAHLFVVPSMIDQIALAGDTSAIPQLWAVAAGDVEQLRDMFIRIKAVEALGRMRATEAADLLRNMVRRAM